MTRARRLDPGGRLDRAWFYAAFVKLTWQGSPGNRPALSLNYDPQDYLNQGLNSFTVDAVRRFGRRFQAGFQLDF